MSEQSCKRIIATRSAALTQSVAPALEQDGFAFIKSTCHFRRIVDDVIQRVLFDCLMDRKSGCGTVTIDLAVAVPKATDLLRGLAFLNLTDSDINEFGFIGTNIGYLRPPYSYAQWQVWSDSSPDELGNLWVDEIERHGLPLFARTDSVEKLADMLETGELGYFRIDAYSEAALMMLSGKSGMAIRRIELLCADREQRYKEHASPPRRRAVEEAYAALDYFRRQAAMKY